MSRLRYCQYLPISGVISTPLLLSGIIWVNDNAMNKTNKIKTFSFMSLDGYVPKAGDYTDWLPEGSQPIESGYDFHQFRDSVSCAVMSGIYHATLQASDIWPLGDKMCYILTPRSFNLAPDVKADFIITDDNGYDYKKVVDQLRERTDGDIWLAGDQGIITRFMSQGLIDEIILNILPVTFGVGLPMFGNDKQIQDWTLQNHTIYSNGVVQLHYTADRICGCLENG